VLWISHSPAVAAADGGSLPDENQKAIKMRSYEN
jgi:hypothetical protein